MCLFVHSKLKIQNACLSLCLFKNSKSKRPPQNARLSLWNARLSFCLFKIQNSKPSPISLSIKPGVSGLTNLSLEKVFIFWGWCCWWCFFWGWFSLHILDSITSLHILDSVTLLSFWFLYLSRKVSKDVIDLLSKHTLKQKNGQEPESFKRKWYRNYSTTV